MAADTTIDLVLEDTTAGNLTVERLTGREALSELYEFRVLFTSTTGIVADTILGKRAGVTLSIVFSNLSETSKVKTLTIGGIVLEFVAHDSLGDQGFLYEILIVPQMRLLDLSKHNQVYGTETPISVKDIIKNTLGGGLGPNHAGPIVHYEDKTYDDSHVADPSQKTYLHHHFVVQYDESDLSFLSRWCEKYGIFYYFTHTTTSDAKADRRTRTPDVTAVFGDSNTIFSSIESGLSFRDGAQTQTTAFEPAVTSFGFVARATPKSITIKDYDDGNPNLDLSASATISHGIGGNVVEYGRNFVNLDNNKIMVNIKAEEIACRAQIFRGRSNTPQLRAGLTFALDNHALKGTYLVVSVEHEFAMPAPEGFGSTGSFTATPYRNRFTAIPLGTPFRPERRTPWPTAHGLLTAKVQKTAANLLPDLDDQGRYKIRAIYDEGTHADGQASDFVRKAEPFAGDHDTGMHFPLREDTEVLLACLNGDIDRPVIVGAVPNPLTRNVVVKGNANTNRIRWQSGALLEANEGVSKVKTESAVTE